MTRIFASAATVGLLTAIAIVPAYGQNREVSRVDAEKYEQVGKVLESNPEFKKRVMIAIEKRDERKLYALAREAGVDVGNMEGSALRYWCETGYYHNLWINGSLVSQCADVAAPPSFATEGE
jgi:hypothetical protein